MSKRRTQIVDFRGKYDIVTLDELRERSDEELLELIRERGAMDAARAAKTLAHLRHSLPGRAVYDRV